MRMQIPEDWDGKLDLIDRLLGQSDQRLDAYDLDFATAVDELHLLARDARPYTSHATDAWISSIGDLRRAKDWLGLALQPVINKSRDVLDAQLGNLPLADSAAMETKRQQIRKACDDLIRDLRSSRALYAAWNDVLEAVESAQNYSICCKRRDVFIAITRTRGYDVRPRTGTLRMVGGVLADSKFDIAQMQYAVEGEWPELDPANESLLAGLPREDRMALIGAYWATEPERPDNIVWLLYRRGLMGDLFLSAGQATFFRADWLKEIEEHGEPSDVYSRAPELVTQRAEFQIFFDRASEPGSVAVRVHVGNELTSKAREVAESFAECILVSAVGLFQRPGWSVTGTSLHFVNGEVFASSWGPPERPSHRHWDTEPPLDLSTVTDWISDRPGIVLTDEVRWTLDAIQAVAASRDSSSSARLAVAVQAVERVNATTVHVESWSDFAVKFLGTRWIVSEVIDDLCDAIVFASSGEAMLKDSGGYARYSQSLQQIHARHSWQHLVGEGLGRAIIDDSLTLLSELDPSSYGFRRLKWCARALSKTKARTHLRLQRTQFTNLVNRCRKYRNAAVHGGPQSRELITWSGDLASRLAGMALSWKLAAHLCGSDTRQTIEQFVAIEDWRHDKIIEGNFSIALGAPPEHLRLND